MVYAFWQKAFAPKQNKVHRAENTYVYHTKIRNDLFLSEVSLWQMMKRKWQFFQMRRIHPLDIRPFWSVCSFETLIAFFSYSSPTSLKVSTYNFILPVCKICAKRCHQDFNKALSLKAKAEYEWTYKMFLLLPSNMSIFTKVVDFTSPVLALLKNRLQNPHFHRLCIKQPWRI